MYIIRTAQRLLSLALLSLLIGCTHPIEISGLGEGDVTILDGSTFCTKEDGSCDRVVFSDYNEVYKAIPRPGSVFSHWINCDLGGFEALFFSSEDECHMSVPAAVVELVFFETMPAAIAVFDPIAAPGESLLALGSDAKLYNVELATGNASSLGSVPVNTGLSDLEIVNGNLYTMDGATQLVRIDFVDGAVSGAVTVGTLPAGYQVNTLSTDDGSALYGLDAFTGKVLEISTADASVTETGQVLDAPGFPGDFAYSAEPGGEPSIYYTTFEPSSFTITLNRYNINQGTSLPDTSNSLCWGGLLIRTETTLFCVGDGPADQNKLIYRLLDDTTATETLMWSFPIGNVTGVIYNTLGV